MRVGTQNLQENLVHEFLGPVNAVGKWVLANLDVTLFSVVAVIVGYILFEIVAREIRRLKSQKKEK